jgi:hypothetical protein
MFLISAFAALALAGANAAPAAPAACKPAADAKVKTKRVCTTTEVTGGRLPHKRCVTVKASAEEPASAPAASTAEAAKPEAHQHHDH